MSWRRSGSAAWRLSLSRTADQVRATPQAVRPAPRSSRYAVIVVFFAQGFLFASWTAHIPHVQDHIHLGDTALGLALLGAPVGSVLAMLSAAYLLPRLGSRSMVRVALAGYCAAGPLVGLTGSLAMLFLALLAWGGFQGALDVSMNTQAISVERRARRVLMPAFHGVWSIGTFAGAACGALAVAIGLSLSDQLLVLGSVCLFAAGWSTTAMVSDQHPDDRPTSAGPAKRGLGMLRGPVLVLGVIAAADMLCEGAASDWSAVYLHSSLHTTAAVAAVAYTVYSLAMVAMRLSGNRLLQRFRTERLLPVLAGLATVGFGIALALGQVPATLFGFACLGAGLAVVIPTVFSAAGRLPGINAGTAVALVSAFGWAGFVFGPPLIGEVASLVSLRWALLLLPLLTSLVALFTARAGALRTRGQERVASTGSSRNRPGGLSAQEDLLSDRTVAPSGISLGCADRT
jgi:predicted MFS family arabinose efflux permease